jgi:hypothetical protein
MALFTPKKLALNWYRYDVSFSLELITSFVQGVEKQAAESVVTFRNSKHSQDGHQGLDEGWALNEIFEDYFPALQRSSAFLTVWAFFEHELEKLCSLYQSEREFGLTVSDLSGKGIDRSTSYLEKVAGLRGLKSSQQWDEIKTVQRIRNVIAHDNGRLRDHQGKPKGGIVEDMKKIGFLRVEKLGFFSGDHEIILAEGFLSRVIDACNGYFKVIAAAVDAKEIPLSRKPRK